MSDINKLVMESVFGTPSKSQITAKVIDLFESKTGARYLDELSSVQTLNINDSVMSEIADILNETFDIRLTEEHIFNTKTINSLSTYIISKIEG